MHSIGGGLNLSAAFAASGELRRGGCCIATIAALAYIPKENNAFPGD